MLLWGLAFDLHTGGRKEGLAGLGLEILTVTATPAINRLQFPCKFDMISAYEDSVAPHLANILHSDSHKTVISSAK